MPGFEVIGKEEQQAVNEIFEKSSGILFAHGFNDMRKNIFRVRDFEKAFAERLNVPYAQAVSSGSTALKVGLKALGVGKGDEVITQSFTFVATVEAILEVGATPVIVDIDESLNMAPESLEKAITNITKAIIPVHMMGAPAEMHRIMAIARKNNLLVLEDTAQGCGGMYRGKHLGTIGHAGTFSFDMGKTIVAGEGGMVVTSHHEYYIRARAYHDHGHEYNPNLGRGVEGALLTGFNYRMTELQAAVGLVQLSKLNMVLENQRKNKKKLMEILKALPFPFRKILDKEGEIADTIVFFVNSKEQAQAFAMKLDEAGPGTKNLPDAINWHFAKNWKHMFTEHGFYEKTYETMWEKSADILERAIALSVNVLMTDDEIKETGEIVLKIAEEIK